MTAGNLEDRDGMKGFPADQQVAFYFRIGPGLQPLFGVPEILIRYHPEGVGRLQARLGFLVRRVFAIGNPTPKAAWLPCVPVRASRGRREDRW